MNAGALSPGDRVLGHDGQTVAVDGIAEDGLLRTVYNLTVSDYHTFFVSGSEWGFSVWVHNQSALCQAVEDLTVLIKNKASPAEIANAQRALTKALKNAKPEELAALTKDGARDALDGLLNNQGKNLLQKIAPATSRLVPGGGLAAHEVAGGHTIARHVGRTDAQLSARLAAEPHVQRASTFVDRATAESAIAHTIDANQAGITTWLGGSGNQLVITHTMPNSVGTSLARGATSSTSVSNVRVIIRRDPSLPSGYRIHTAYPEP